jgi:hypothetical protein
MRAHPALMRLLFRVPSLTIPAQNLSISSFTCLGFRPSSRHHEHAATDREVSQNLATVRPRLSQPLDGFIRAFARRLISSRCHVQGSFCSRGFSPRAATLPHRKKFSPLPLLHRRLRLHFHFRRSDCATTCDASRLRGFYPRKAAFHESGYSPRPQPLPSSVSSPPGSFLSRRRHRFTQRVPLVVFSG